MTRTYYVSCRLSEVEYEDYKRVMIAGLPLDILSRKDLSNSDLFRLLIKALPKFEGSFEEFESFKVQWQIASLIQ